MLETADRQVASSLHKPFTCFPDLSSKPSRTQSDITLPDVLPVYPALSRKFAEDIHEGFS